MLGRCRGARVPHSQWTADLSRQDGGRVEYWRSPGWHGHFTCGRVLREQ